MRRALGHLDFNARAGLLDFDDTFVEWSKVASKSSKISLTFLASYDDNASLVIMLITDEVYRYMTLIDMSFSSRDVPYAYDKASSIQILASDARSPVYASLCHLSSVLSGRSSRLRLIYFFVDVEVLLSGFVRTLWMLPKCFEPAVLLRRIFNVGSETFCGGQAFRFLQWATQICHLDCRSILRCRLRLLHSVT